MTSAPPIPAAPLLAERLLLHADRHRRVLFGALAAFYLLAFNTSWRIDPDGALYLSLGRNLAEGLGYTYHGAVDPLAFPGLPYLLAFLFRLFGPDAFWAANLLMLLCAVTTLALTYRLFLLHENRPVAVLMTLGLGFTRTFYRFAFTLMTDMPFLMGVIAFLAGYEAVRTARPDRPARWYDWALMIAGIAVAAVMRPAVVALVPVVIVAIAVLIVTKRRWKTGIALLAVVFLAGIVLAARGGFSGVYARTAMRIVAHPDELSANILSVNGPKMFKDIIIDVMTGLRLGPMPEYLGGSILNILAGVAFVGVALMLFRRNLAWGAWIVCTLGMMLAVLVVDRYFLAILPLMIYAWWRAVVWIEKKTGGGRGAVLLGCLLAFTTIGNFAKDIEVLIEQRRPDYLEHYKDGRYVAIQAMAREVTAKVPADAVVIAPYKHARVMSYWSRRDVIEQVEHVAIDPSKQKVFIVLDPYDPREQKWLEELNLRPGQAIASVPRKKQYPPLTLHEAQRSAP